MPIGVVKTGGASGFGSSEGHSTNRCLRVSNGDLSGGLHRHVKKPLIRWCRVNPGTRKPLSIKAQRAATRVYNLDCMKQPALT